MGIFDKLIEMQQKIIDKTAQDVSTKCTHCGAPTKGKTSDKTLTCNYCGGSVENPHYIDPYTLVNNTNPIYIFSETEKADNDLLTMKYNENKQIHSSKTSVYAWIEKSGLFYKGEIPGINFSSVNLCHTYEECIDKLKAKFYKERSSTFYEKPQQNIEKIKSDHPKAEIIILD